MNKARKADRKLFLVVLVVTTEIHAIHASFQFLTNKSSAVAEMSDRSHNRHGPKTAGRAAVPLSRGELGPRLTQYGLG